MGGAAPRSGSVRIEHEAAGEPQRDDHRGAREGAPRSRSWHVLEEPMPEIAAYAAPRAGAPLAPWKILRREPGPSDVVIDVRYRFVIDLASLEG